MLEHVLVDLIDGAGNLELVVDCRHAVKASDAVAEALAAAAGCMHRHGGQLVVHGPGTGLVEALARTSTVLQRDPAAPGGPLSHRLFPVAGAFSPPVPS